MDDSLALDPLFYKMVSILKALEYLVVFLDLGIAILEGVVDIELAEGNLQLQDKDPLIAVLFIAPLGLFVDHGRVANGGQLLLHTLQLGQVGGLPKTPPLHAVRHPRHLV